MSQDARTVFQILKSSREKGGARSIPIGRFSELAEISGLPLKEVEAATEALELAGLVKPHGTNAVILSEAGKRACIHPEELDAALGPQLPTSPSQTFNVGTVTNGQFGNDNTMNVTYQQLLTQLERDIDESDLPKEKKSDLKGAVLKLVTELGPTLLGKLLG